MAEKEDLSAVPSPNKANIEASEDTINMTCSPEFEFPVWKSDNSSSLGQFFGSSLAEKALAWPFLTQFDDSMPDDDWGFTQPRAWPDSDVVSEVDRCLALAMLQACTGSVNNLKRWIHLCLWKQKYSTSLALSRSKRSCKIFLLPITMACAATARHAKTLYICHLFVLNNKLAVVFLCHVYCEI